MSDYVFYNEDDVEIGINDIDKLTMFSAKDTNGNYIVDTNGNNVFVAMDKPTTDKDMGLYVNCKPVGRLPDAKTK